MYFHQPRSARLGTPPIIERWNRDVMAFAKFAPRLSAALELLYYPPDVSVTPPLLAHAAIFGQLAPFFKMGSLDAY
jgi:hypothetical protein